VARELIEALRIKAPEADVELHQPTCASGGGIGKDHSDDGVALQIRVAFACSDGT
jgi:hypothetical protein